jgi:hypothetical protein
MTKYKVEYEPILLRYGFAFQQGIAEMKSGQEMRYGMAWFLEAQPHAHFLTLAD